MKKFFMLILALVCLAACAMAEEAPDIRGTWIEAETEFTWLNVSEWDSSRLEFRIESPMTHAACVYRFLARYDGEAGMFVYTDGEKYDLNTDGTMADKPSETNLQGTVKPEGEKLIWSGVEEEVVYERTPPLPAYRYTGDDPVEGAVAELIVARGAVEYNTEPGSVTIPCPVILKREQVDDTHVKIYGNIWVHNYVQVRDVLSCISGGECPMVLYLEETDGVWKVTKTEEAGEGTEYTSDIIRMAGGDKELKNAFFTANDELMPEVRRRFIREYVEANDLEISAYEDSWGPEKIY